MIRTTLRRVLVVAGAAALAAGVVALPASAGDAKPAAPASAAPKPAGPVPGGFASWADVYAFQSRLNAAANQVLAAGGAGNASVVASPVNRELRVYWHGAVPDAVTSSAARAGVPVRFLPAAYRLSDLVAEAQRLAVDPRIAQVSPKPDGSGLAVTVVTRELTGSQTDVLRSAQVPLTVTVGQRPEALFSRQADTPFFWGGSRYNSAVGGCSNGFALRVAGTATDTFEISAGHCATNNGDPVTIPGQPSPTGSALAKSPCRDTLVLNYPGRVSPRIYTGPFTSSTSAQVVGAAPDFVGNFVNTGGASSGEHNNIPVTAVNNFVAVGGIPCATVGPLNIAATPGVCAVAPGDSGGPVYAYSGPDVVGRGTVTAGFSNVACPGVVPVGSDTVFYAPLLRPTGDPQIGSLQFYGVSILT